MKPSRMYHLGNAPSRYWKKLGLDLEKDNMATSEANIIRSRKMNMPRWSTICEMSVGKNGYIIPINKFAYYYVVFIIDHWEIAKMAKFNVEVSKEVI